MILACYRLVVNTQANDDKGYPDEAWESTSRDIILSLLSIGWKWLLCVWFYYAKGIVALVFSF